MPEKTDAQITEIVRPLFPQEALFVNSVEADGSRVLSVGWRLGLSRMENWSKEVRLVLGPKILERYGKLNDKGRRKAENNLVSFVQLRLAKFNPHHDRPRYLLPPVEIWKPAFEEIFPNVG